MGTVSSTRVYVNRRTQQGAGGSPGAAVAEAAGRVAQPEVSGEV
jgi:hypothetical protein